MFPIRCVVEVVRCPDCVVCSNDGLIIVDSFAIVAGQTRLSQLVETVLTSIGLQHLAPGAKGKIQVNNWKALAFEEISDDPDLQSVDSVLKDISNHVSLQIRTKQPQPFGSDCAADIKGKLLKLLFQVNPQLLGCLPDGDLKQFAEAVIKSEPQSLCNSAATASATKDSFQQWAEASARFSLTAEQFAAISACQESVSTARNDQCSVAAIGTKFNAMLEVPKLERWFKENPNPSRSNFRRHSSKISYQHICNWFSNARALQRKELQNLANSSRQETDGSETVAQEDSNQPCHESKLSQFIQALNSSQCTSPGSDGPLSHTSTSTEIDPLEHSSDRPCSPNANDSHTQDHGHNQGTDGSESSGVSKASEMDVHATTSGNEHYSNIKDELDVTAKDDGELKVEVNGEIEGPSGNDVVTSFLQRMAASGYLPPNMEAEFKPEIKRLCIGSAASRSFVGIGAQQLNRLSMVSAMSRLSGTESPEQSRKNSRSSPNQHSSAAEIVESILQNHPSGGCLDEAIYRSRSRLMFDPLSEVPVLERWFIENPHPSWLMIDQYTEALNSMPYRQTYPPVTPHNVKIWFKNRRAKSKRMLMGSNEMIQVE